MYDKLDKYLTEDQKETILCVPPSLLRDTLCPCSAKRAPAKRPLKAPASPYTTENRNPLYTRVGHEGDSAFPAKTRSDAA